MSRLLATVLLLLAMPAWPAAPGETDGAGALRERHEAVRTRLDGGNAFGRPIALDSREGGGKLRGDVYAVIDHPFATLREALASSQAWCDILTLPFNVKGCRAQGESIALFIGRTPRTPIEDATRLDFRFRVAAQGDDYLRLHLGADSGPVGTRDYRIAFAATPLQGGKTFVHLHYGYQHGVMSSLAMQAYLAGAGADKVGFTSDGRDEAGRPALVGGMRGVVERNTMRYFLAIEAYLDAMRAPPERRFAARLESWFEATERYPRQLREMPRSEYLAIKRADREGRAPAG